MGTERKGEDSKHSLTAKYFLKSFLCLNPLTAVSKNTGSTKALPPLMALQALPFGAGSLGLFFPCL